MAIRVVPGFLLIAVIAGSSGWSQTNNSGQLVLSEPVHHHDWMAREPMVVEHPNGTLFVSGYGSGILNQRPTLWKSRDHGATWSRVNVGTEAEGALGNSDVDLAVARDGTLYFASMGFNNKTLEGAYVAMGVSRDAGETWSWTTISKNRFDDRPWVQVAPDGTAHVIWNDGNGVLYRQSRDRGATWTDPSRIHDHGGSSHLAVGPNGEVAVRIIPRSASGPKYDPGVDLIAVSQDGGKTWRKHDAPGDREWTEKMDEPVPRWVEPLAWDSEGALYSFWTNMKGLWLARSSDKGETWKTWQLNAKTDERSYFPYLAAGSRAGELAATWFSGHDATLEAHLALIQINAGDAPPRFIQSPPFRPDSWYANTADLTHPLSRSTAGEYLAVIFLRSGGLGVVSPMSNVQEKRAGFSWWRAEIR
jgi:hypothetical protein